MPDRIRAHQHNAVDFALQKGSAALFLDTGLGKSLCAFTYADNVASETGKPVLMLAPLGVTGQHFSEAGKFGFDDVRIVRGGDEVKPGLNLCNYERLHLFNPGDFGGLILDESSVIKNFSGVTTRRLMEFGSHIPYRLACTATPAPNDHMELGQHCQFLGVMSSSEMLSRWFLADQSEMGRYRLKRHAVNSFWNWVASWAR
jgi:superfamily II DNA or RNA helicase